MRFSPAILAAALTAPLSTLALERGLAWGTDDRWGPNIAKGLITWYHHWQDGPNTHLPADIEFVPMFWGPSKFDLWNARKAEMNQKLPSHLLSFNEPDITGQSNMGAAAAAALHMQELQPWARRGVKVSSPNIVWKIDWMDEFMKQCNSLGCTIDFVGIHWYGSYTDLAGFKTWVTTMHTRYNKPIWVTEYGVTASSGASQDQVKAFHMAATAWMETQSFVERAAWLGCYAITNPPDNFASNKNAMFNAGGTLRDLAYWYIYTPAISKRSTFSRHHGRTLAIDPATYGKDYDDDDDEYNHYQDVTDCGDICELRKSQLDKHAS